jgi:hypothetical protein
MTDSISMRSAGAELAAGLAAIKAEIDAEIGAYPTPIPRCDAQFNRLYEQRTELAGTIAALNDALADDTTAGNVKAAIGGFVARPPYTSAADEARLRERMRAVLSAPAVDRGAEQAAA